MTQSEESHYQSLNDLSSLPLHFGVFFPGVGFPELGFTLKLIFNTIRAERGPQLISQHRTLPDTKMFLQSKTSFCSHITIHTSLWSFSE
jgi:hypothetical protein